MDDDPDEARGDDDDGNDFPLPGVNFPGRFLPAGELFSLSGFCPRGGGGIFLLSVPLFLGHMDDIRERGEL